LSDAKRLELMSEALEAQQQALDELVALTEKQSKIIAGMVLALHAVIDLVLDEQQRAAFRTHVDLMAARHLHEPEAIIRMFMD
jgi:hypothetical protein